MKPFDLDESPRMASVKLMRSLGITEGQKAPWLNFPEWMEVSITFPFAGAAARFRVRHKENPDYEISVYHDVKSVLGSMPKPYFEAYPIGDDTGRFYENETDELMAALANELLSKLP